MLTTVRIRDELNKVRSQLNKRKQRDLCSSPGLIRTANADQLRRVGHIDGMGKQEIRTEFMWDNFLQSGLLEDRDDYGKMSLMLKRMLVKWVLRLWTGL
jgi:uncharacterized protein YqgQ